MKAGRKIILLLALIIVTRLTIDAQKNNSSDPFFIIQVTDPQFGMYESDKGFNQETRLYEKAVTEINRLKPDLVFITGDLVNKKDNRAEVEEFKSITRKINPDIPVYVSPGNHDIGQPASQKDIDSFIADYGYDRISFKYKKCLFIGLNSVLIKAESNALEQAEYLWLEKELSKGKRARHIIIFTHYPFFINSFDEPETYSNIGIETRNRYMVLFQKYNVDAVFAGHLHNNGSAKYGKMEMVTTSAVGKPLAKAPSGFRIIKVYPDRVESSYHSLDSIPEKVTF